MVTVFNLDPSIGLEELYHSFVTFGDVKDVLEVPHRANSKIIEFYDGAADIMGDHLILVLLAFNGVFTTGLVQHVLSLLLEGFRLVAARGSCNSTIP